MESSGGLKYILTAAQDETKDHDDDKDKQIASLQKAVHDKEDELKDAKAKLQAQEREKKVHPHPPEVRELRSKMEALLQAMDEEEHMKGMDEEHREKMKAGMVAIMEVYDEGNGTQVGNPTEFERAPKTGTVQGEPSTKVSQAKTASRLVALERKVAAPLIKKILTAKTLKGASEDAIKIEEKRLYQMPLSAVEHEYENQKIFIEDALTAAQEEFDQKALIGKEESTFDFNGIALTGNYGNEFSIDKTLGGLK